MLVRGFPAGPPATNCYVVAAGEGEECVVVDPGIDAVAALDELLAAHRLRPVAVLLTHGHIDHTFSVAPVCGARGIPAWVHPADRRQIADPWSGVGAQRGTPMFGRLEFTEPDDVRELVDGEVLRLAGLELTVELAPGHTPGSVVFSTPGPLASGGETEAPLLWSGDVLFRDSIGRMDLPGGSEAEMAETVRRVCLPRADETVVLPGHGPATTIGRERELNPYVQVAAAGATSFTASLRGL